MVDSINPPTWLGYCPYHHQWVEQDTPPVRPLKAEIFA